MSKNNEECLKIQTRITHANQARRFVVNKSRLALAGKNYIWIL